MDTFHSELFWQALPVVRVTSVPTSRPLQPFVDISRFERQTSAHRPRIHRAPAAGKAALRHSPKRSKACHFAFWSWKVENHSSANTDVHSCKINKFKIKVYDKFDKWQKGCKPNYFTSSDPHHDMLGGGCQVRVVIENMMGRMENLRTLISGLLGLVILVRWALVTMFLSWTTQTGCRIHRTYVSLIGSGEGRHTTHLLKCVLLLSTSRTDWKQSSDVLSDISFDILSDISSDISSDILSDISSDILSDIFLTYLLTFWQIFWHSFWHIFWHSFWHIFRHAFWHIFWHSFWHIKTKT